MGIKTEEVDMTLNLELRQWLSRENEIDEVGIPMGEFMGKLDDLMLTGKVGNHVDFTGKPKPRK